VASTDAAVRTIRLARLSVCFRRGSSTVFAVGDSYGNYRLVTRRWDALWCTVQLALWEGGGCS